MLDYLKPAEIWHYFNTMTLLQVNYFFAFKRLVQIMYLLPQTVLFLLDLDFRFSANYFVSALAENCRFLKFNIEQF